MIDLIREVRTTVDAEMARAQDVHGLHYASAHEGYGVLAEEMYEAETETIHLGAIKNWLMNALHADDPDQMVDVLDELAEHATLAACEYIQVAAVAQKMIDTIRTVR